MKISWCICSILIIALIYSCSSKIQPQRPINGFIADTVKAEMDGKWMWWFYNEKNEVEMNTEAANFFLNWKTDSAGYHFRRKYIQFFSAVGNGGQFLKGMRKSDVAILMGKYDYEKSGEGYVPTVNYNMEWGCGNPEYDCCWLCISFDEGMMVKICSVACS